MRIRSRKVWFSRLSPADAARFVVVLEATCQHDWRRITRTTEGRLALRYAGHPNATLTFGATGQDIAAAVAALNRPLSSAIVRRCTTDPTFRDRLLMEGAARHLVAIVARLSATQGFRLTVACERPRRSAEWAPTHVQDEAQ